MALDGLRALFGAALAPLAGDGVLHRTAFADDGAGGFATSATDVAVKVLVESLAARDRVASGLPAESVTLTVLRAGLAGTIAIDDAITVGGATYRVVAVAGDAAQASFAVTGVPA